MDYLTLSNTDLVVSRVGFGAEPIGGTDWGDVDLGAAFAAVARAWELGITLYDTADVYGLGRSEELLSQALGAHRHDAVIITKFGVNWHDPKPGERAHTFFDASPARVTTALENSLRRLRLDCIPLYLVHWPDASTPITDTLEALHRCQEAGKVRHIGVSNFPASLIREAYAHSPLAAVECQFNLVDQTAAQEILPACRDLDVGVVAYGPLAQGLLTGRYRKGATFPSNDRRHRLPHFSERALSTEIPAIARMTSIKGRYDCSLSQMAIRWVLDTPGVNCAIVGAKTPTQVDDNAGAAGWRLEESDVEYLAYGSATEVPR